MPSQSLATTVVSVADVHVSAPVIVGGILTPAGLSIGAHQAMASGTGIVSEPKQILSTGQERLIRTRLIRSSTLFEVSVKCFAIILLSFHV